MNRERLARLATMLENYREATGSPRFDLGVWGTSATFRGGFLWLTKHRCNTAACAVGLACLSREFSAEGLSFLYNSDDVLLPVYGRLENWAAVEAFFDLTERQGENLFNSHSYRVSMGEAGARNVARRIRSFIKPRKSRAKGPKTDISALTAFLKPPAHKLEPAMTDDSRKQPLPSR